ncbi:uncharacterized protein [Amphiura filiformis]|uniref:uncharacterized protein n=1 Tax=Amphiura filiformis TaxID=82378 RepID=UPI003B2213E4
MSILARMNEINKRRPSGTRSLTKPGFKRSFPEAPTHAKKKVGGYLIGDTVGEGSFAKVRSATHILTQERVAIKIIDKKLIAKRDYVRRNLRREAAMLQKLRHPYISQLYEVMETSNNYYLVLEFADGGEFMKYLCEKRRLSERECRKYIRQLVSAVDHMHRVDIIHRDIKVENFLLDEDMNLKVIDFGLSNILGPDGLLSTQCGSPAYAAPEIFCNSSYGPAVDVWSIGVNMYAMLTGELPFVVDPPNNMTKLHARILQGCNIPVHLTKDCQDLLGKLMTIGERERITIHGIMKHPWINRGYSHHLKPSTNTGKLQDTINVDEHILSSMKDCGYNEDDVKETVLANKPLSENASYYLMIKRLNKGWGYPEGRAPAPSYTESTFEHSPRPHSPAESLSPSMSPVAKVVRPLSGKTRPQHTNGNIQVSEVNRRNEQARRLKSPIVGEDYGECNIVPSRLLATINIVRSPSKESIFEDMKRTLERSMTNLDINNNRISDDDSIYQDADDATTVQLNTPEPLRDLESRLSTHSHHKKVASIVCDKNGRTGTLSSAYLQGKPVTEKQDMKDTDVDNRSTSKRTRLFHKRSDKERRHSNHGNKSGGCIVIVNGRLTDTGESDSKPRTISRAEGARSISRADVPDRVGSALKTGQQKRPLPLRNTPRSEMQRPHTEGSVDIGRSGDLSMDFDKSPFAGRGFPQHKLGLYYSTSGRHTRSVTYATSPLKTSPSAPGRPNNGRPRHAGQRHQRSFTAPNPVRYYNGTLPTPKRHLATAPSSGNYGNIRSTNQKPFTKGGLPSIFISSFKNM